MNSMDEFIEWFNERFGGVGSDLNRYGDFNDKSEVFDRDDLFEAFTAGRKAAS